MIEDICTVIGVWPDSEQKFMESIFAESGDKAADKINSYYPGLMVAGVIRGEHQAADTQAYVY